MKIRQITLTTALLVSFLHASRCLAQDSLFFNQPVDSVVMIQYEWSPKSRITKVVDKEGKLTVVPTRKAIITPGEQKMLIAALNTKRSFGGGRAGCYEPRHGLIFYRNGSVSGHLTICMTCNYLVSSQDIPAQQQNAFEDEENGHVYYLGMGMSKKMLARLDRLFEEYGFSYKE
jgi:hypothetical protein